MNWFKFYGQDWLTDPKLFGLTAEDKLCFISLLCLASASENPGEVKNITEDSLKIITRLEFNTTCDHNDELGCEWCHANGVLDRLQEKEMIRYDSNTKRVTVVNYLKRQTSNLSNAERQALFRERLKKKP